MLCAVCIRGRFNLRYIPVPGPSLDRLDAGAGPGGQWDAISATRVLNSRFDSKADFIASRIIDSVRTIICVWTTRESVVHDRVKSFVALFACLYVVVADRGLNRLGLFNPKVVHRGLAHPTSRRPT